MTESNSVSFFVNGKQFTLSDVEPTQVFNSWLRTQPGLTGTKAMCYEGGCGSCVIALQRPFEGVIAVNSCLLLLCTIDGCHITTVEGIGSNHKGYDEIQTEVAHFGGSQCGYCTPGFVMSMKSLLESDSYPTQQTIEDNFDGNICRCTGYRSILDAMKTFASNADKSLLKKCSDPDIEDLGFVKCCKSICLKEKPKLRFLKISGRTSTWVRPTSFLELRQVLTDATTSYKIVCGNTSTGLYKEESSFPLYVDVGQVQEFQSVTSHPDSFEFGASVTLNKLSKVLSEHAAQSVTFQPIASHITKIANKPVRNFASWAGNIMVKHAHRDFPSDVCTILEAGNALVKVYNVNFNSYSTHFVYGSNGIMNLKMNNKVIVSMTLPKFPDNGIRRMSSYKVSTRAQNAHAYVNAAFSATLRGSGGEFTKVTAVFGGLQDNFDRAHALENYLKGKAINSNETLKGALTTLSKEIIPASSNQYKHNLALGLFYKFYLSLCDSSRLGPGISSGITSLERPISSGTQVFKTDPSTYPVSKNIPKLTGVLQASGEAQYISDILPQTGDLYCNVVLAEVGNADIDTIDVTDAEKIPGCVAIITRHNFPAKVKNCYLYPRDTKQPIIATDHVTHAGQILAIVVADNVSSIAAITSAVKVTYKNKKQVILSNQDAISAKSFDGNIPDFVIGKPDEAIAAAKHTVFWVLEFGQQYHFYMETHSCRAMCTENGGLSIDSPTQVQRMNQVSLSYTFGIPAHKIEITTKRLGGAYGGKATNSQLTSCIAALAAHVTNRPVHFHATLETSMKMLGTRTPYTVEYKVGFDDDGIMAGMDVSIYSNSGCNSVDGEAIDPTIVTNFADSAYFCANRRYKKHMLKTNLPASTWCRSPASLQMTASADLIVEHVASYLKKDPIEVKQANLYKIGQQNLLGETLLYIDFRSIYDTLLSKYKVRERMEVVENFNQANKWKKKGIAVTPMKFRVDSSTARYSVLISIYASDGSVLVSHGGIDSGQGINTKIIQTVAYKFNIPVELVTVQRTSTITSANSNPTGGSITSENVCNSALACCEFLNSRIEPIRAKMSPTATWQEVISQCYSDNVDLSVSNMSHDRSKYAYNSFGVTAAEVEYDVITGERQILQVDTIFDCGISLNPNVDIGQIEGAFVMGIGFWLTEKMVYDETTGVLLSDNTDDYKPPSSKDIPIKWNIELLQNAPNPLGVLRSKASGEPPLCMSICVAHALKRAVEATRKDRGITNYFPLPSPATVDALHNSSILNPVKDFILH